MSSHPQENAIESLARLEVGATAVVRAVSCARPVRRRLLEMGLLPGTVVRVVRTAPLGDPLELALRGYSLSIRRAEAMGVEVSRVQSAPPT